MAVTGSFQRVTGSDPHAGGIHNAFGVAWGSATMGTGTAVVSTGLSTVVAFNATPVNTTAPAGDVVYTHDGGTAGVVTVYGWKPSAAATTTLVAGTGTEVIRYFALGTL